MSQQDSGEKTEKASQKKKEDARKRGEVHMSRDFVAAASMIAVFALMNLGYSAFADSLRKYLYAHLASSYVLQQAENLNSVMVMRSYEETLRETLPIVLPLMLAVMVIGVVLHVAQTGPLVTLSRLQPNFSKINPLEGFKRMFSGAAFMELMKSIFKISLMGYVIYQTIRDELGSFQGMMEIQPWDAFDTTIRVCAKMGIRIGAVLAALAAVDILYQWWKYEKDLRMTKQEVKEENKQLEGDPQVKGRIRQLQRRMSTQRMMQNLKKADVVVTNPTQFAVALRYQEKVDPAPVVVAKGQDYLAAQIKRVAKENHITIVENKPVARALYAACNIGQAVPVDMYQAIADILIYVYKVTNRMPPNR
jgi:flagellar biosynthetic protein FlhB